jgi:hypothetical protein
MKQTTATPKETTPMNTTHETYISAIRDLALTRVSDEGLRGRLAAAKLVYGSGMAGTRGVTFYSAWHNEAPQDFVEICATGEESDVQIAGTTLHELAHVLAGPGSGHGKAWKAACAVLGLISAEAAGQAYAVEHFDAALWIEIAALALPEDGRPIFRSGQGSGLPTAKLRPCPLGIGTRGGKSRGTGSGSRLRLYVCGCAVPVRVRVASDAFDATCNRCAIAFTRAVAAVEAA